MTKSINYNSGYLYLFTVSGIFLLNFILKISFLGSEPFWYDESISIKSALLDFGHVKHQSDWDNNPPFYYYCLWVWLKIFGISEFKARLLGLLFSCFSATILFAIAKKYFNYITGISAALLFTFHNFSYEYTHEARAYTLVVMLTLISSYLFLRFLESPSYRVALFIGLVNFLIIYTHYIAGLILLFQFSLILFSGKKTLKFFSVSILLIIALVLIRFTKKQFILIFSYEKGSETFWLKTTNADALKTSLQNLLGGNLSWVLCSFLILAALVFFIYKYRSNLKEQNTLLVYSFLAGTGSILVLYFIGLYKPLFLDRYLLFTVPYMCLIIAWLLCNSFKPVLIIIPLVLLLEIMNLNPDPKKSMDFRTAAGVVKKLDKNSNSLILIQTRDVTGLFAYYYNRDWFLDQKRLSETLKKNKIMEIGNLADFKALSPLSENTIIFCQTFEKREESNQIFDIFKQNNYIFTSTNAVKGVRISLVKKIRNL